MMSEKSKNANVSVSTGPVVSSSSSSSGGGGCPYAVALSDDDECSEGSSSGGHGNSRSKKLLLQNCPAFTESSGCPFKEAKCAKDVKQTLLKLPPSHLEKSGQFFKIMEQFHHQILPNPKNSTTNTNDKEIKENAEENEEENEKDKAAGGQDERNKEDAVSFPMVPGGCPMQGYYELLRQQQQQYPQKRQEEVSFSHAMEDFSLSAIMARMAQDMEMEEALEQQQGQKIVVQEEQVQEEEKRVAMEEATAAALDETATTTTVSLSDALKTGTEMAHAAAENIDFVSKFIRGNIDRQAYKQFVLALYYVYQQLEQCLHQHAPKQFPTCHYPQQLNRTMALEDDIDFWFSVSSPSELPPPSPATREYMDRLQAISKQGEDSLLLLAHAYTRYLGDLSGGTILGRVARKALGLQKDTVTGHVEGLMFYQFTNISSPKKFKDQYRTALNQLQLSPQQIQNLVKEANIAFCLNIRIFQELSSLGPKAIMPLQQVLQIANTNQPILLPQSSTSSSLSSIRSSSSTRKTIVNNNATSEAPPPAATTNPQNTSTNKCPFLFEKSKHDKNENDNENEPKPKQQQRQPPPQQQKGKCPWPFILLHDPKQGFQDYKTWVFIGLLLSYIFYDRTDQ